MGGIFSKPDIPQAATPAATNVLQKLKPTRMPTEDDPDMLEAARRTRKAAMQRRGRLSTIMTDGGGDAVGSSGKSLGA